MEENFYRILKATPDLFFLVSSDGNFIEYFGDKEIFYMPHKEFRGKNLKDIMPKNSLGLTLNAIKKTIKTKKSILIEYCFPIKDEFRHYEARIFYFSMNIVAWFIQDITNRKVTKLELRESERKYLTLINKIKDVIVELNKDGIYTYVSSQIYKVCGYETKELIGQNIVKLIHPNDKLKIKKAIEKIKNLGEEVKLETKILYKKRYFYVPISFKFNLLKYNEKISIFGVMRDISKRKKAEFMIKKEMRKLEELEQIKDEFILRASHELKTPLNSIISACTILLNECGNKFDDKDKKLLEIINNGGLRLKNLVEKLLYVSKIESNNLELKKVKINIVKTIRKIVNDLEIFSVKRNLFLNFVFDKDIFIHVDKFLIEQAIVNLLENSIKNTLPGGVISISLKKDDNYLEIKVKDTGIGFTDEEKGRIFKKFGKIERGGKGMDIDTEGPGLGLYYAKEIIKLHNGKICFESKGRNKGSTFIVKLPIS
ncbi:MAG: ATP-binding protein [Promethearchaeota archaeon]